MDMKKSAVISKCGQYRFLLKRIWDELSPPMIFIMLNPPTADTDDPTIRLCIEFAEREGRGGIAVVNLYPLRTSDMGALFSRLPLIDESAWKKNQNVMISLINDPRHDSERVQVVCGWGSSGHGIHLHHAVVALAIRNLDFWGADLYCFGKDRNDNPRPPRYWKKDSELIKLA